MSIAILLNVPKEEREWLDFSFHNFVDHLQINDAIAQQKGVFLVPRPIDPIPEEYGSWLELHQQWHSDAASALGITDYDLGSVDFSNEAALSYWIQIHYQQHLNMRGVLAI
jgi:hypothetical protein